MTKTKIMQVIPSGGIIAEVKTPFGEPVLVVPHSDFVLFHKENSPVKHGNFCCILDGVVVASDYYTHDCLNIAMMEDYTFTNKTNKP